MAAGGGAFGKLRNSQGGTHSGNVFLTKKAMDLAGIKKDIFRRSGISPQDFALARQRENISKGIDDPGTRGGWHGLGK